MADGNAKSPPISNSNIKLENSKWLSNMNVQKEMLCRVGISKEKPMHVSIVDWLRHFTMKLLVRKRRALEKEVRTRNYVINICRKFYSTCVV